MFKLIKFILNKSKIKKLIDIDEIKKEMMKDSYYQKLKKKDFDLIARRKKGQAQSEIKINSPYYELFKPNKYKKDDILKKKYLIHILWYFIILCMGIYFYDYLLNNYDSFNFNSFTYFHIILVPLFIFIIIIFLLGIGFIYSIPFVFFIRISFFLLFDFIDKRNYNLIISLEKILYDNIENEFKTFNDLNGITEKQGIFIILLISIFYSLLFIFILFLFINHTIPEGFIISYFLVSMSIMTTFGNFINKAK